MGNSCHIPRVVQTFLYVEYTRLNLVSFLTRPYSCKTVACNSLTHMIDKHVKNRGAVFIIVILYFEQRHTKWNIEKAEIKKIPKHNITLTGCIRIVPSQWDITKNGIKRKCNTCQFVLDL